MWLLQSLAQFTVKSFNASPSLLRLANLGVLPRRQAGAYLSLFSDMQRIISLTCSTQDGPDCAMQCLR